MFQEVDDKLYAFEQLLYYEILNEHTPVKQTIVRGNQVLHDGTMVQGHKAQKQIMVAIYERLDV